MRAEAPQHYLPYLEALSQAATGDALPRQELDRPLAQVSSQPSGGALTLEAPGRGGDPHCPVVGVFRPPGAHRGHFPCLWTLWALPLCPRQVGGGVGERGTSPAPEDLCAPRPPASPESCPPAPAVRASGGSSFCSGASLLRNPPGLEAHGKEQFTEATSSLIAF